jgi:hypothetical protein
MSKYQFRSKFVEVSRGKNRHEIRPEVEVEIRGRSRQTNRRSRMLKHYFVQYDNFL